MNRYSSSRPLWAEIDLSALRYNLAVVKKTVGSRTRILSVVKANAYGHGAAEVARQLERGGVHYLGVVSVEEGVFLRKHGIRIPILLFDTPPAYALPRAVSHGLTVTVCDRAALKSIDACARKLGRKAKVHVEIDTGMGRLGVWHEDAGRLIREIPRYRHIELEGIFTHLSSADEKERAFTMRQLEDFERLLSGVEDAGIRIPLIHASNSMGLMGYRSSHFNLVRPGIMLYGLYADNKVMRLKALRPVMSLKARIIHLKRVPKGRAIGYGRTYLTERDTAIATLPVGYGDGYRRLLSNRAEVLIKGRPAPIVGVVCMDHVMVDVGHLRGLRVGDEVTLMGKSGTRSVTAEDLAEICGTISYEIVTGVAQGVPRVYTHRT